MISFGNLTKKSKSRSDQEIENDELKNFYIKIPNLKIESTSTDNTVGREDFKQKPKVHQRNLCKMKEYAKKVQKVLFQEFAD